MKNSIKILLPAVILWFALVNSVSCISILEKPAAADITIDTIFSNRQYAMSALANVYHQLVPRGFPYTNKGYPEGQNLQTQTEFCRSILASITDEGCNTRGASSGWYVNDYGLDPVTPSRNQEDAFGHRWPGIKAAWVFINNIDRVPESEIAPDEKEDMKAEVKTLIALAYMEMVQRYGAIPIVDRVLGEGDDTNLLIPRGTLQENIDFIIRLCDEAAPVLPDTYASNMRGRITKGVPLCIKARILLYAASPLYNGGAGDMILQYDHPEFVCLGGYDKERWLAAAEASNAVLQWAKTAGVSLITAEDIGGEDGPKKNAYGYATSVNDNKEVIFANKGYSSSNNGFGDGIFWKFTSRGLSVMFNTIPNFRKADGSDQEWPDVVGERHPYSELQTKINEMEPRFSQCVWVAGQPAPNFTMSGSYTNWPFGKIDDQMGTSDMYGVGPMVKFHYNYANEKMKDWIVFRLAEFYLNYAEATYEYYGSADAKVPGAEMTAAEAVNAIRNRGGLRSLNDEEKADFRTQVRRERTVELFAEGHRWWDCRRWKTADEAFGSTLYTFRYVQNVTGASATAYSEYYLAEHIKPRYWSKAMYFYPFPQEEVDKGYLVQNPGY